MAPAKRQFGHPRKFGHAVRPDSRDFLLRAPKSTRQWRCWAAWWHYWDQGPTSKCCSFTGLHLLNAAPRRQYIDPHYLYELAKQNDEWQGEDYEGTSVRAVMKVLTRLGFFKSYKRAKTAEAVARWVLEQGPVPIGTDFYAGMLYPDARNRVHLSGEILGGHAQLVRGFNRRTGEFRLKGSYGRNYGQDGDTFISFDDLDQLLAADGEAWVGEKLDLEGI